MAYTWDFTSVMQKMVGVSINTNRRNQTIICPSCGKKKYDISTTGGHGHCWSCEFKSDHVGYISKALDISSKEVRTLILSDGEINRCDNNANIGSSMEENRASDDAHNRAYLDLLSQWNISEDNYNDMYERCHIDRETLREKLMYRTLPVGTDTFVSCKRLQHNGCKLDNVAGFYRAKSGKGDFMWDSRRTPGIVMPLRNYKNQIIALQIRKNDRDRKKDEEGKLEHKCSYFTSAGRPMGAHACAGVHYACDWRYDERLNEYKPIFENGFVLTEGIMKADIIHYLLPNLPVISVPGVSARTYLSEELDRLKSWGVEMIRIAFDQDYKTNPHVQNALEKTCQMIKDKGFILKPIDWISEVSLENEIITLNGLDDYLAYTMKNIKPRKKYE